MSQTRAAVIGAIGVGAIAAASYFSGGEPQPAAAPAESSQHEQAAAERHPGREAAKARARERMVKRLEREAKERGRGR